MLSSDVVVVYLATLMWNESQEDLFQGMLVCGLLVRNRVLAGWNGQDWIANIRDFDKHSANPPTAPRILKMGDPVREDRFRRCLGMAVSIYEGREKDITCGALRAAKLNEASPEFIAKIIQPVDAVTGFPVHARVAHVGQQACFR
jgi:hypothetical protein